MAALKKCLGVDIGVNAVKIVEVALEATGVRVTRSATVATGTNSYANADEQRAALVKATKDAVRQGGFTTKNAIFSLSGQKAFFRRFIVPKTTDERLKRLIQYEAREQIPFPLDKATIQYEIRDLEGGTEVEVLLAAVRNDEVREFMQLVNKTGLTAVGVGVSSFSLFSAHRVLAMNHDELRKLIESGKKQSKFTLNMGVGKAAKAKAAEATQAGDDDEEDENPEELITSDFAFDEVKGMVNLGAASFDVAIGRISGETASLGFCRTVLSGGDAMTRSVLNSLNLDSFEDAEAIKVSSTRINTFASEFEEDSETNEEASQAVTVVAEKIANEIRRTLEYFLSQRDGMAIDALVISGGVAHLSGFDSLLEEKLSVPVSILRELPEGSVVRWGGNGGDPTSFLVALGLALQGVGVAPIKIDFLPEERKIIRDFPYALTGGLAVVVLATGVLAAMTGGTSATRYAQAATDIENRLAQSQGRVAEFQSAQQVHDQAAQQIDLMGQVFGQRDFWLDFIARLVVIKPPQVIITSISLDHDGDVEIVAVGSSPDLPALFNTEINRVFAEDLTENSRVQDTRVLNPPPSPFTSPAHEATLVFNLKTKVNHLQITPTPSPTPVGGGGGFFGGPRSGGVAPGGRR